MVSSGWFFLAAMIWAYGVANLLQSVAATRTTVHHTFDPALLLRLAGLAMLLGDRIEPGRGWLAALGFVATLAPVIGLTRYAEPQHHHATSAPRRPDPPPLWTAPTNR